MRSTLMVILVALMTVPVVAQQEFDDIAAMQALERRIESYRAMGMHSDEALEAAIITSPGLSMQQRMLLLTRVTDDPVMRMMGPALLGQGGGTGITAHGDALFVAENGWIYRIDLQTLEVMQSGRYRPEETETGADLGESLEPMLDEAREEARAHACLTNMKQLCLAALMYAQDWDEHLVQPGQARGEWPEELYPYLKNRGIFQCPSRPDVPIAYAFNEQLFGVALATITNPAETVVMFETLVDGEAPAGGLDLVPDEGIHNGLVCVGFVDGHAKLMTPDALREALERDPFE